MSPTASTGKQQQLEQQRATVGQEGDSKRSRRAITSRNHPPPPPSTLTCPVIAARSITEPSATAYLADYQRTQHPLGHLATTIHHSSRYIISYSVHPTTYTLTPPLVSSITPAHSQPPLLGARHRTDRDRKLAPDICIVQQ